MDIRGGRSESEIKKSFPSPWNATATSGILMCHGDRFKRNKFEDNINHPLQSNPILGWTPTTVRCIAYSLLDHQSTLPWDWPFSKEML